jgi:hypothetical protein
MLEASAQARRLSPAQLRAILRDPANGTAATGLNSDKIGVMPDLSKIAAGPLNLTPDVYMRDFVGDQGAPNGGAFSTSPDIIVLRSPEPDPKSAFGAGSGHEDDDALSVDVVQGQQHYVYARLRNRGGSEALSVNVDVYYAPPASLILPTDWTLIGSTVVASVPVGNVLTVSDPIPWAAAAVPPSGHYCFVATAGGPGDPAPTPAALAALSKRWDNYLRFVGANNNVVWRNFDVVSPDPEPPPPGSEIDVTGDGEQRPVELTFYMVGAPDEPREMGLDIVSHLPPESTVHISAPPGLLRPFGLNAAWIRRDGDRAVIRASANGRFNIPPVTLDRRARVPVTLHVWIPEAQRRNAYEVYARQTYKNVEVGRFTWRLQRRRARQPNARPQNALSAQG